MLDFLSLLRVLGLASELQNSEKLDFVQNVVGGNKK
jgi:hypothetical protein